MLSRTVFSARPLAARLISTGVAGAHAHATSTGTTYHTSETPSLAARFREVVPERLETVKRVKSELGNKSLGECTVGAAYGGMRGITSLVYEPSLLDAEEGIRFRGLSIPECQEVLPVARKTKAAEAAGVVPEEPTPEALFWLLMTGEVPTQAQADSLSDEWAARSAVPGWVTKTLEALPKDMHPMTKLSAAVLMLQKDSKFHAKYSSGTMSKTDYADYVFEDSMDLIAKLPTIAAQIYTNTFRDSPIACEYDTSLDWSGNYAKMMGFNDENFLELMRLYLVIHSDHEGGNVSAHTVHLVNSALSDPYLSFSAGMNGLAGPLHGLANQECLKFAQEIFEKLGGNITRDGIKEEVWNVLNSGRVVPGFGHAVLRKTDPRYTCQRSFALKHLPEDPMFKLVSEMYHVVPDVLTEHGKTANPWPNVDAHSGVLLQHYGLKEPDYYTVMFGVSRALGVLANITWTRALGFPLERPKSITTEAIMKKFDMQ